MQSQETEELIDKMFDGSREDFFASFVNMISEDEARKLRNMIDKM